MEAQLTAFIGTNQVQQAIATMKALEQAGGGASLTQLYLKLGKLLQRELEQPQAEGKTRRLRPDAPGVQDVPHDPGREQDRPDLRVAGVGRREPPVARRLQGGRGGAAARPEGIHPGSPVPPAAQRSR